MNPSKRFKQMMKAAEGSFAFRLETIILEITEHLVKVLEEKNINRTRLAEMLEVSPAAVTKILNGTSNFTLKTLLSLADALDVQLEIRFREREVVPLTSTYQWTTLGTVVYSTDVNTGTIGIDPGEIHISGTTNFAFGVGDIDIEENAPSTVASDLEEIDIRDAA